MNEPTHDGHRNSIALWVCVALVLCSIIGGVILFTIFIIDLGAFRQKILIDHFIALFGLPSAAAAAFIIVTLFRQGEEPIRIKGLGFEIQGAAGPVVLWVLCFLAICGGIKLLW
jgi:hypothetical protein